MVSASDIIVTTTLFDIVSANRSRLAVIVASNGEILHHGRLNVINRTLTAELDENNRNITYLSIIWNPLDPDLPSDIPITISLLRTSGRVTFRERVILRSGEPIIFQF